jgi:hypothetical protein
MRGVVISMKLIQHNYQVLSFDNCAIKMCTVAGLSTRENTFPFRAVAAYSLPQVNESQVTHIATQKKTLQRSFLTSMLIVGPTMKQKILLFSAFTNEKGTVHDV